MLRTDPPNDKSVRVMLRLGMTHESTTDSMVTYLLRRPFVMGMRGYLLVAPEVGLKNQRRGTMRNPRS